MRRTKIKFILYVWLTLVILTATACSSFPEVCSTGVPTVKNCFSLQGNKGAYSFGPINLYTRQFD